jgi:superfamily I DNA/RNA helicase
MDAIEAARREAEKLHLAAIEAGSNTACLLDFVLDEANRRGIEVCPVPQGDPQLKCGKAVFDNQALTIFYENIGSDFEKAFLVAHEIGHVVLEGDVEDDVTLDVDPERSVEEPAVGAQRIIDYGGRERREVTMDLFAREFLAPRSVISRMHIAEGLTSEQIAGLLKVPLMLVLQQLLDALLLPVQIPDSPDSSSKATSPDESQVKAASHRGSPYQLQAGPGTGKTKTLVHRIEGLLREGVDPASILVLTFSNKAAGELRERIAAKYPSAVTTLWIGTFHSFGLDIVHRFGNRLGLSESPRVISLFEAIDMLEGVLATLPLKHFRNLYDPTLDIKDMLGAISRAKDEVVDAAKYRQLTEAMMRSAQGDEEKSVHAEKCLDTALLYELYERLLREKDSVDFGDLVSLPVSLVEQDEEVRNALCERHQHILVDEYQDVNRASVRLLKAVSGDGDRLWVVGDSRQSIYRFRGASSINMKCFGQDFPGGVADQLKINYRSTQEIVDLYTTFSANMKASEGVLPMSLNVSKGSSSIMPKFLVAGTLNDEISALAQSISKNKEAGFDYKSQAVLCVSNNRLSEIASGLEALGVPVLYLGSLFEREEIKDLLSLLSLVADPRATGLIRAATLPGYALSLEEVVHISRHLKEEGVEAFSWQSVSESVCGLSEEGRVSIRLLAKVLEGFESNDSPWAVLATLIIDRLGLAKKIALSEDPKLRMKGIALWQLTNFCHNKIEGKGLLIERLLAKIRRIVLLSEDRDIRQLPQAAMAINGVRLMTIHGSKGLEFDVVHMPGLVSSGLPGVNRTPRCVPPDGVIDGSIGRSTIEVIKAGHEEEEECKFFVGTSRAKERLLFYASSVQPGGRARNPSRYIDTVRPYIQQISVLPPTQFSQGENHIVPVQCSGGLSLTDSQLSLYNRCPRRFLYTHVLALGGRRTQSAFLQMHSAVREVLDWIGTDFSEANPTMDELNDSYERAWLNLGPVDHGYAEDYRKIGHRLVEFLMETRTGKQFVKLEKLKLSFPGGDIIVSPDEITLGLDGHHSVRRIKTGKLSSGDNKFDDIEYTILFEAAQRRFGSGVKVEAVHLASETQEPVIITNRKKETRLANSENYIRAIINGEFPRSPNVRICPTCPSFFICGKVPAGSVEIKNNE